MLALQRSAGNAAVARQLALAREPAPPVAAPPAEAPPEGSQEAPELDAGSLTVDLMTTGNTSSRIATARSLQELWPLLERDLLAVPRKNGKLPSSRFSALRTPERSAAFLAMTPEQRAHTAATVFDALVFTISDGVLTAELVDAEMAAIGSFAAANVIGLKGGWPLVRDRIYTAFGTLEAARDYYELMMRDTRFFGKRVIVHAAMEEALKRAETKFQALGGDPASQPVQAIGGLAIRPNANVPGALSDHSFGWAVDLNAGDAKAGQGVAAGNPNVQQSSLAAQGIPDFWAFVQDITGDNAFKRDPASGKPRSDSAPGLSDERTSEAERLSALSDRLMAMFANEQALMQAMVAYVESQGVTVPTGAGISALTLSLAAASIPLPKAGKKDPLKGQRDAAIAAIGAQVLAWHAAAPGFVGPLDAGKMATRLYQMGVMFMASGNASGAGVPIPGAEASPTLGSIAAHGFMNLDPLLVGALSGTDGGGGLRWLGGAAGTKDFMHFELAAPPAIR